MTATIVSEYQREGSMKKKQNIAESEFLNSEGSSLKGVLLEFRDVITDEPISITQKLNRPLDRLRIFQIKESLIKQHLKENPDDKISRIVFYFKEDNIDKIAVYHTK